MKTRRRRFLTERGNLVVRYIGMVQCICGQKWPFIDLMWTDEYLEKWRLKSFTEKRAIVRIRRGDALRTLETFVLTSELCHEGEDNDTNPSRVHSAGTQRDVQSQATSSGDTGGRSAGH